jgi:uncharacterized protein (DUF2147 family)
MFLYSDVTVSTILRKISSVLNAPRTLSCLVLSGCLSGYGTAWSAAGPNVPSAQKHEQRGQHGQRGQHEEQRQRRQYIEPLANGRRTIVLQTVGVPALTVPPSKESLPEQAEKAAPAEDSIQRSVTKNSLPPEDVKRERLIALGKLWALIKFFHPYLAYKAIDWDGAFAEAIAKVETADNDQKFALAVEGLLGVLHDPVTKVFRPGDLNAVNGVIGVLPGSGEVTISISESPDHHYPLVEKAKDGIFVVHFADCNETEEQAKKELNAANHAMSEARGLVFDLRGESGSLSEEDLYRLVDDSGLRDQLLAFNVKAPTKRSRIHFGYAPDKGITSGEYYSAFKVTDAQFPKPSKAVPGKALAFVVDSHSHLSDMAVALQHAGKAYVVAEPDFDEANIVSVRQLQLPGGITVRVRMSEIVFPDGSIGFQPNKVVRPGQDPSTDQPLQSALAWVREGKSGSSVSETTKMPASSESTPASSESTPARSKSTPAPSETTPAVRSVETNDYPSESYRILAAFKIWAVFNYFFPYKDLMPVAWDTVLADSIPSFQSARNAQEYALAVAHMVSFVHDSHAFVAADVLGKYFGKAGPPFECRFVEHQMVVTNFVDRLAGEASGIKIGDVILEIDGQPVQMRAARIAQSLSVSTAQALAIKVCERVLSGADGSLAAVTVNDGSLAKKTISVLRKWDWPKTEPTDSEIVRVLPGNIGYVNLNHLKSNMIDSMFDKCKDTKAIIFDMRGYPHSTALPIAARLAQKDDIPAAKFIQPILLEPSDRSGDCLILGQKQEFMQLIPKTPESKYQGKTVMLMDARTEGAAEHLGLFLKAANGTVFVGSATSGTVGTVTDFYVPGGILIGLAGQAVVFPDGKQIQRKGLTPDVEARPTIAGVRAGKDEVLDKAIEYLTKSSVPPAPASTK